MMSKPAFEDSEKITFVIEQIDALIELTKAASDQHLLFIALTEELRRRWNQERPHSSLSPTAFADQHTQQPAHLPR